MIDWQTVRFVSLTISGLATIAALVITILYIG
jgi:hypothetical protein